MPRSKTIALMFALCACVITGFLAHHLYENHLSSEFRRVLIAANDEHETPFDQTSYLHEARLAVRTRKDQQVLEQFERADALGTKSNNALSRIAQEMSIESDYVKKVSAIIDAERASVFCKSE